MFHSTRNGSSAVPGAASGIEAGVLAWLDDMLNIAHVQADAALARLVAELLDDLGAAAARHGGSDRTANLCRPERRPELAGDAAVRP